jgi:predicted RNase H-like nuclease
MDIYVGFDSAWTDNPKAPGAICAVGIESGRPARFHEPRLASFDQARTFIQSVRCDGTTLVGLDQPSLVPNSTGMRPVDRVAASLASWLGGGVQPANRGKLGMFCDASPIWRFLVALDAVQDQERARVATDGIFLMEVFPALALPSLAAGFFGRRAAPKYNPANSHFRRGDWDRVAYAAKNESRKLGCEELANWCTAAATIVRPRKADQDKLDSVLCVLIALRWRLRPRTESLLVGDLTNGYMVLPASPAVREYLTAPARKRLVPMDGLALT